jgi:hypothetical protein
LKILKEVCKTIRIKNETRIFTHKIYNYDYLAIGTTINPHFINCFDAYRNKPAKTKIKKNLTSYQGNQGN